MVDFHTHILPGVDDGSKDVEESLLLLERLYEQGITTVVATPHFYANEQSMDEFICRRNSAYEQLAARRNFDIPHICLGAEVQYYPGISRLKNLNALCIEGTRTLLLELPFSRWSSSVVREVVEIANTKNITVVLAHIERYMKMQRAGVLDELLRHGILMQINASFLNHRFRRAAAIKLLRRGSAHLLGSDCHGISTRPPEMGTAMQAISRRLGKDMLIKMTSFAESLLSI